MELIEFIKPEFVHSDDRGYLKQLFSDGWKQTNVIFSEAGTFRGGHYHKNNLEGFYIISGEFELILEKDDIKETHMIKEGDMFLIKPYISHSFNFTKDTTIVSFYDKGVVEAGGHMDIYDLEKK